MPALVIIPIIIVSLVSIAFFSHPKTAPMPSPEPLRAFYSPSPQIAHKIPNSTPSPQSSPSTAPQIEQYIDAIVAPSPSPSPAPPPQNTNLSFGGNYSVLTFDLGATTVVTDSAYDDDCSNNCATKSLSQFVSDNGGKAGINGTYFCPPDYSWCSGKVNSTDFPIWNNRKKKWMSAISLFWNGRAMMVFRPGSAQFFPNSASVGAPSDITGGIVNYPALISGGQTVYNNNTLSDSDKLKTTRGTRNGIGFGGGKLFLVVARNANMDDLVNIFHALGATDAMNTDGGGSSALYQNGSYYAGPGRSLPNAVIVK